MSAAPRQKRTPHTASRPPAGATLAARLPRAADLRILGNGVVPQQATHALRLLLARRAAVVDVLLRAA